MAIDFSDLGAVPVTPSNKAGGIDFSDLGATDAAPVPMGGKPPIGYVMNKVASMAPWNKASQALKDVAGATAERMGEGGVPPYVAASTMLPLAIAPDLLAAGTSLGALEGESTLAKAIQNTPEDLSKQYSFQREAARMSNNPPIRLGKLPGFEKVSADIADPETMKNLMTNAPISYPKDTAGFLRFAEDRMKQFGESLSPDELDAYYQAAKKMVQAGAKKVNAMGQSDLTWPLANRILKTAQTFRNNVVNEALQNVPIPAGYEPTANDLDRLYALSSNLRKVAKTATGATAAQAIWKYLGPKFRWGDIFVQ